MYIYTESRDYVSRLDLIHIFHRCQFKNTLVKTQKNFFSKQIKETLANSFCEQVSIFVKKL